MGTRLAGRRPGAISLIARGKLPVEVAQFFVVQVLYFDHGVPVFDDIYFEQHTIVKGDAPILEGETTIEVDFDFQGEKPEGPAAVVLKVNGQPIAKGTMKATVGGRFGIDTFGLGEDNRQPVSFDYKPPFKFGWVQVYRDHRIRNG